MEILFVNIAVPLEAITEANSDPTDVLELYTENGKLVISNPRLEDGTLPCSGEGCGDCPFWDKELGKCSAEGCGE